MSIIFVVVVATVVVSTVSIAEFSVVVDIIAANDNALDVLFF